MSGVSSMLGYSVGIVAENQREPKRIIEPETKKSRSPVRENRDDRFREAIKKANEAVLRFKVSPLQNFQFSEI